MSSLLGRLVNWLVRGVKIEQLRVRDLRVGNNTTILTNDWIEFDALGSDPAVAPTGKARLCAVSGNLRTSFAAAYSTVGSGGGGGSTDMVSRAAAASMASVGTGPIAATGSGATTLSPVASANAGGAGSGTMGPTAIGSAALV